LKDAAPLRPGFAIGVGAAAGFLSGLLGIGGGLVAGPALAARGLPLARALGTSVAMVGPVAAVGALAEGLTAPQHLAPGFALLLALGGQLGAPLGARALVRMPERVLRAAFVALLAYAAARNLGLSGAVPDAAVTGLAGAEALPRALAAAAIGVFAGVSASLFGIGGGLVAVPGLVFVVGGFDFHMAAGTSLLAMVPTALRAGWIAHRQGRVDFAAARALVPAAVVAAVAAVLLRNLQLDAVLLARVFGAFLLLAGARLWFAPPRAAGSGPA